MIDDVPVEVASERALRLSLRLPGDATAVTTARRAVARFGGGLDEDARTKLGLLVTELVANSVRHASPKPRWIRLDLELSGGAIRVDVSDPGNGFVPPARPADPVRESGFGLVLVDELADRWGVDASGTTRVWIELGSLRG